VENDDALRALAKRRIAPRTRNSRHEAAEDSRRGLAEGFGMPTLALNRTSRYSCALIKRREPRAARESTAKHDSPSGRRYREQFHAK